MRNDVTAGMGALALMAEARRRQGAHGAQLFRRVARWMANAVAHPAGVIAAKP